MRNLWNISASRQKLIFNFQKDEKIDDISKHSRKNGYKRHAYGELFPDNQFYSPPTISFWNSSAEFSENKGRTKVLSKPSPDEDENNKRILALKEEIDQLKEKISMKEISKKTTTDSSNIHVDIQKEMDEKSLREKALQTLLSKRKQSTSILLTSSSTTSSIIPNESSFENENQTEVLINNISKKIKIENIIIKEVTPTPIISHSTQLSYPINPSSSSEINEMKNISMQTISMNVIPLSGNAANENENSNVIITKDTKIISSLEENEQQQQQQQQQVHLSRVGQISDISSGNPTGNFAI